MYEMLCGEPKEWPISRQRGIQPRECQCRNKPAEGLRKGNSAQPSNPKKSRSLGRWRLAVENDGSLDCATRKAARAVTTDRAVIPLLKTLIAEEAEAARMLRSMVLHGRRKPSSSHRTMQPEEMRWEMRKENYYP